MGSGCNKRTTPTSAAGQDDGRPSSEPCRGGEAARAGSLALIQEADRLNREICSGQRQFFEVIEEVDRRGAWWGTGARDTAQWLWMRYGVSDWKAHRLVHAARALKRLPKLAEALSSGELGVDKVVELARFAAPDTEQGLISWAKDASSGAIRRRADAATRQQIADHRDAEETRYVDWWYFDEGKRFALKGELPAAQGGVVEKALERLADELPKMPGEEAL